MKVSRAHEMRGFLISITALVILLIVLVVLVNTIFSIRRINQDQERAKQNVKDQLVLVYSDSVNNAPKVSMDPVILANFDPTFMQAFSSGDMQRVTDYLMHLLRPLYAAEYGVAVINGKIAGSATDEGLEGYADFPLSIPDPSLDEVQSEELTSFNGEEGYFISIYSPLTMPGIENGFFNFVIDRTAQIKALEKTYSDEKTSLIVQQVVIGLVAIAIALILSLIGVRVLTRRFITGPIEQMTAASHEIMEGTFKGEVVVDEESDFADLQRLLQSGKMLVDRMCEEPPSEG